MLGTIGVWVGRSVVGATVPAAVDGSSAAAAIVVEVLEQRQVRCGNGCTGCGEGYEAVVAVGRTTADAVEVEVIGRICVQARENDIGVSGGLLDAGTRGKAGGTVFIFVGGSQRRGIGWPCQGDILVVDGNNGGYSRGGATVVGADSDVVDGNGIVVVGVVADGNVGTTAAVVAEGETILVPQGIAGQVDPGHLLKGAVIGGVGHHAYNQRAGVGGGDTACHEGQFEGG